MLFAVVCQLLGLYASNEWQDDDEFNYDLETTMPESPQNILMSFHLFVLMKQFKYSIKNAVFWDETPCGSCKNRSLRGTYHLHHQVGKNE
jgi:hypothetical protein